MIQSIEVIRPTDREKASVLFHHDGVEFDLLFAHVLTSEVDQEIRVTGKDGKCKHKIPFCKVFSLSIPRSSFFYKGSFQEGLHAFHFDEGDIISFEVRDGGALAGKGLKEQLIEYYAVYRSSPLVNSISSKAMHEFLERVREARRTYHVEPPMPLIFGVIKREEVAWR